MHRIDGAGHVLNQFVTEDAATNRPPTEVTDFWLNAVQEEIANAIESVGIVLAKNDNTQLSQVIGSLHGRLTNVQVFSTPGSFIYTPSLGTNFVLVEVIGGGGAGGGTSLTGGSTISVGGGGGGGAYARKLITGAFSGVTVTVGAGGVGAASSNGGSGGSSSFGALVSCAGGGGGATVIGAPASQASGGTGASMPTSGDINFGGTDGAPALAVNTSVFFGGNGGAGPFCGSGYGAFNTYGTAGKGAGSGGGGSSNGISTPAKTGGDGSPGAVIVWEFR